VHGLDEQWDPEVDDARDEKGSVREVVGLARQEDIRRCEQRDDVPAAAQESWER